MRSRVGSERQASSPSAETLAALDRLAVALLLVVHCGSRFAVGEVNAEEQAPPGTAGQRMLIVRWPDDTESEVPRFYADEVSAAMSVAASCAGSSAEACWSSA